MVMAIALGCLCRLRHTCGFAGNTLVLGPGGYRFVDFVKVGLPLLIVTLVLTILVAPLFFPF
jgi:sodium-dependent dicarboxylate transporter 2/3/5